MSWVRRDEILRSQQQATLNYLLALVEPIEHAGRFIDGFELYATNAVFHAEITSVLRDMLPALVNGYAGTARKAESLRMQRIAEETSLMRPMALSPETLRLLRWEVDDDRRAAGEAEGSDT